MILNLWGRGGMVDTTDLKLEQQAVSSQIQKKTLSTKWRS